MENGQLVRDDKKISESFNDHYINIIENITGKKQQERHSVGINTRCQLEKEEMLNEILERYSCHPSFVKIKSNLTGRNSIFQFSKVEPSEILKIIKGIKPGTSVGVDNIPPKFVVMSAEIIAETLNNLTNATMLDKQFFQM